MDVNGLETTSQPARKLFRIATGYDADGICITTGLCSQCLCSEIVEMFESCFNKSACMHEVSIRVNVQGESSHWATDSTCLLTRQ